jgi:hypothetical protein
MGSYPFALQLFIEWNPTSTAADMLPVSVDATIAIAFGLGATIISLITIYIMWKDRDSRRTDSRSGEYPIPSLDSASDPNPIVGFSIRPQSHYGFSIRTQSHLWIQYQWKKVQMLILIRRNRNGEPTGHRAKRFAR